MKILPVEAELLQSHTRSEGETNMTTLKVGFRNFVNAHASKNTG
jgi:hypothetical protein